MMIKRNNKPWTYFLKKDKRRTKGFILKALYKKLTKPQQELFKRMYISVEDLIQSGTRNKIDIAINQCGRSVCGNKTDCATCDYKIQCAMKINYDL